MSDQEPPKVMGGPGFCPTCGATPEQYGMPCDDPWHLEHPRTTIYMGTPKAENDPFEKLSEQVQSTPWGDESLEELVEKGRKIAKAEQVDLRGGDAPWYTLFWEVALILQCLPSSIPNGNAHVLKKAREAMKCYEADHTQLPKETL